MADRIFHDELPFPDPPFEDLCSWFSSFESELLRDGFIEDARKFSRLVTRIPMPTLGLFRDMVVHPPEHGKYEAFKCLVLQKLGNTAPTAGNTSTTNVPPLRLQRAKESSVTSPTCEAQSLLHPPYTQARFTVTTGQFQATACHATAHTINELPPPYVGTLKETADVFKEQPGPLTSVACSITSATCVFNTQPGSQTCTDRSMFTATAHFQSASTALLAMSDDSDNYEPTAITALHTLWLRALSFAKARGITTANIELSSTAPAAACSLTFANTVPFISATLHCGTLPRQAMIIHLQLYIRQVYNHANCSLSYYCKRRPPIKRKRRR